VLIYLSGREQMLFDMLHVTMLDDTAAIMGMGCVFPCRWKDNRLLSPGSLPILSLDIEGLSL